MDRISALPDEVIIHILSFLTIKEVAVTSLVSKRWKDLWRYIPSLNLDAAILMGSYEARIRKFQYSVFEIFTHRVDTILDSHRSPNLHMFRVCSFLSKIHAPAIDRWVSFVITKKVEWLELNLSEDRDLVVHPCLMYDFPCHLFAEECVSSSLKYLFLRMCRLRLSPGFHNFKLLQVLSLKDVDLTDDVLDKLLSNLPLLERLCVQGCPQLVNLELVASSSPLKYLEVYVCNRLKNIEIYAASLLSFKYLGVEHINLSLQCVPLLVEVYFGGRYASDCNFLSKYDRLSYFFSHQASISSQLETLILDTMPIEVDMCLKVLPTFLNLKLLTLLVHAKEESFVGFSYFLRASPVLHLLKLHILARKSLAELSNDESGDHGKAGRQSVNFFENVVPHSHQYLKEVELSGFRGYPNDMELARYLLKHATALNKFTIDPYCKRLVGSKWLIEAMEGMSEAREYARQLLEEAPPSVQMKASILQPMTFLVVATLYQKRAKESSSLSSEWNSYTTSIQDKSNKEGRKPSFYNFTSPLLLTTDSSVVYTIQLQNPVLGILALSLISVIKGILVFDTDFPWVFFLRPPDVIINKHKLARIYS